MIRTSVLTYGALQMQTTYLLTYYDTKGHFLILQVNYNHQFTFIHCLMLSNNSCYQTMLIRYSKQINHSAQDN